MGSRGKRRADSEMSMALVGPPPAETAPRVEVNRAFFPWLISGDSKVYFKDLGHYHTQTKKNKHSSHIT